MNFLHRDLGDLSGGEVIEVALTAAANVKLMRLADFNAYSRGAAHHYHGGHVTHSPFRIAVPGPGRWVVAVDLGGYPGSIRAGLRLLR